MLIVRLLCKIFIFFEKKLIKNLEMGYKLFYLCSRNQGMRVKPIAQVSGGEGLVSRVLGCAEFFRILPWSGSEKNFKNFF